MCLDRSIPGSRFPRVTETVTQGPSARTPVTFCSASSLISGYSSAILRRFSPRPDCSDHVLGQADEAQAGWVV